jgi:hypothetical protein
MFQELMDRLPFGIKLFNLGCLITFLLFGSASWLDGCGLKGFLIFLGIGTGLSTIVSTSILSCQEEK